MLSHWQDANDLCSIMLNLGPTCSGNSSSEEVLLRDIEEISDALYFDRVPSRNLISRSHVRSQSTGNLSLQHPISGTHSRFLQEEFFHSEKKSSIWNWKPLKVLTNLRSRRFNICFFTHVHSIQGLPSSFNNESVFVRWKGKEDLQTCAVKVFKGTATFDGTLMHQCSIYGSRQGPLHTAKYESKRFLLYACLVQAPGIDIGKHWIDLTKLLPLTFEDLDQGKSMGMWSTSFKLSGKAKGAFLNVSFGFLPMKNDSMKLNRNLNIPELLDLSKNRLNISRVAQFNLVEDSHSLKGMELGPVPCIQSTCIKSPPEIQPHPGLSKSMTSLFEELDHSVKVDAMKGVHLFAEHIEPLKLSSISSLDHGGVEFVSQHNRDDCEYTIVEQGVEFLGEEHVKSDAEFVGSLHRNTGNEEDVLIKHVTVPLTETYYNFTDGNKVHKDAVSLSDFKFIETEHVSGMLIDDPALSFHDMYNLKSSDMGHPTDMFVVLKSEKCLKVDEKLQLIKTDNGGELDDDTDSEEAEFLKFLGLEQCVTDPGSETDPESPRELLLREFEKDVLASGNCILNVVEWGDEPRITIQYDLQGSKMPDSSRNLDFSFCTPTFEEHTSVGKSLKWKRNILNLENLDTKSIMLKRNFGHENFKLSSLYSPGGFGSPIYVSPTDVRVPTKVGFLNPFLQSKRDGLALSTTPFLLKRVDTYARLAIHTSTQIVVPSNLGTGAMTIVLNLASIGVEKLSTWLKKRMPFEDIGNKSIQIAPLIEIPSRCMRLKSQLEEYSVANSCRGLYDETYISRAKQINKNSSLHSTSQRDLITCATTLEDVVNLAMERIEVLLLQGLRIQYDTSSENATPCIFFCSIKGTVLPTSKCSNHSACTFEVGEQSKSEGENAAEFLDKFMDIHEWIRLYAENVTRGEESGTLVSGIEDTKEFESRDTILGNHPILVFMVQLKDPSKSYEPIGMRMLVIIEAESCKESIAYFKLIGLHLCGLKSEPGTKPSWGSMAELEAGYNWLVANGIGEVMEHLELSESQSMATFWSISYNMEAELQRLETGLYVRNPDLIIIH